MSEFWKRTLSGTVYVAVIAGSILWHEWAFDAVSALLAILAVREYNRLTHPRCRTDIISEAAAGLLGLSVALHLYTETAYSKYAAVLYIVLMLTALIAELWRKNTNPISDWGNLLIGQILIALPFALMDGLRHISPYLLLAVFVLIWVNDSFAYCVGVLSAKTMPAGNHKMFPRVSPKKSWEGLIGGVLFTIGAALLLNGFGWFEAITPDGGSWLTACVFALVVSTFGTLGDLMESLFKRSLGVKDSGRFLPGHGGVLDRFDSILLAAPATLLFVLLMLC